MSFLDKFRGWFGAPDIFESELSNFTPRAQTVLALARKEADRLHHSSVGTEHLLVGLLGLGQGVAVNVLGQIGVKVESLLAEMRQHGSAPDPNWTPQASIPYSASLVMVLNNAQQEARDMHHTFVGTEHLLLGLLRVKDCEGARCLNRLGVKLDELRERVQRELNPNLLP